MSPAAKAADVFISNPWVKGSTVVAIVTACVSIAVSAWQVRADIANLKNESYMKAEAEANALRQAVENPGMRVPNPRNPGEVFEVKP